MIKHIEALYYKGFKYLHSDLTAFNIFVGPNASGKSSFLDILMFLRDVLHESPQVAVERRSAQFQELVWNQERKAFEFVLEFQIPPEKAALHTVARYEIAFSQNDHEGIVIEHENLWLLKLKNGRRIKTTQAVQHTPFPYELEAPEHIIHQRKKTPTGWRKVVSKSPKGNDYFRSENTDWNIIYRFGPRKASLARIPEDETRFPISLWVKNVLMEGIQFLQLNSANMRWPCRPDTPVTFAPDGSNLPKVAKYLQEKRPPAFTRWVDHVKTALPIDTITVEENETDRHLYLQIQADRTTTPSWLLSDGTLRLLAQTIIAYLPECDQIYMIEEPENGLHPQAIETAMQSLSSVYDNQIILATHSPVILRLAEPKDILCFAKTTSGAVDVVRGEKHPKLKDWKKDIDLATLHAAGVLQ